MPMIVEDIILSHWSIGGYLNRFWPTVRCPGDDLGLEFALVFVLTYCHRGFRQRAGEHNRVFLQPGAYGLARLPACGATCRKRETCTRGVPTKDPHPIDLLILYQEVPCQHLVTYVYIAVRACNTIVAAFSTKIYDLWLTRTLCGAVILDAFHLVSNSSARLQKHSN
jgi:hypothetical protein